MIGVLAIYTLERYYKKSSYLKFKESNFLCKSILFMNQHKKKKNKFIMFSMRTNGCRSDVLHDFPKFYFLNKANLLKFTFSNSLHVHRMSQAYWDKH